MGEPFYRMFPQRWDEGTYDLPLEVEAAYLRLINLMYRERTSSIPNRLHTLQAIWRCGNRRAAALLKALVDHGKVTVDANGIHNAPVQRELEACEKLSETRRSAGSKGGQAKATRRSLGVHSTITGVVNAECSPSEPSEVIEIVEDASSKKVLEKEVEVRPKRSVRDKSLTQRAREDPDGFEAFWEAYPRRPGRNRGGAAKAYGKALKRGGTPEAILAGALAYAATRPGAESPQFIAMAETWLNQNRWEADYSLPARRRGRAIAW